MSRQNSLSRMILNSRIVYMDGKTIKDIRTLSPEIKDVDLMDLEENYEITFYDRICTIVGDNCFGQRIYHHLHESLIWEYFDEI